MNVFLCYASSLFYISLKLGSPSAGQNTISLFQNMLKYFELKITFDSYCYP